MKRPCVLFTLPKTKKYLFDLESAIEEIEAVVKFCNNDFDLFTVNPIAIRSLERLLEIIGEAMKRAIESNSNLVVENSDKIISLRNRLAHGYDSIDLALIWSIAIKNIPELKKDLASLN